MSDPADPPRPPVDHAPVMLSDSDVPVPQPCRAGVKANLRLLERHWQTVRDERA